MRPGRAVYLGSVYHIIWPRPEGRAQTPALSSAQRERGRSSSPPHLRLGLNAVGCVGCEGSRRRFRWCCQYRASVCDISLSGPWMGLRLLLARSVAGVLPENTKAPEVKPHGAQTVCASLIRIFVLPLSQRRVYRRACCLVCELSVPCAAGHVQGRDPIVTLYLDWRPIVIFARCVVYSLYCRAYFAMRRRALVCCYCQFSIGQFLIEATG